MNLHQQSERNIMDLEKIKIGVSSLTGQLYIYRHGVNESKTLDKRHANQDVIVAFIQYMMHDAPEGAIQEFEVDDQCYRITVEPIEAFTV